MFEREREKPALVVDYKVTPPAHLHDADWRSTGSSGGHQRTGGPTTANERTWRRRRLEETHRHWTVLPHTPMLQKPMRLPNPVGARPKKGAIYVQPPRLPRAESPPA
ncbi:hypothetical protein CISG_10122 [Coccidioides immitis RMSCC 3703]|uniref:Uncharacterized protein n=2 Tax=Coccidioides immitis TaxID=5501 RepID=A0A0J8TIN0_COCIT|nr:hypothetical protein CIRG_01504 [Coccidioides immitis RMSCC 2394]KMU73582.1 hypothetical protein CISG_10122 [Coccidioides immitis RMSCC 3703]